MARRNLFVTPLLCTATTLLLVAACSSDPGAEASATPSIQPLQAHDGVPPSSTPAPTDPALDRAKAAAMDFSSQLRGALQAAMEKGGPVAAVDVCHAEAPRIADTVMARHGVRLGRVALPARNRNPAQAADGWQLATLEIFQQRVVNGEAAADQMMVVREHLPDGIALRMARGIATEPGCLACHGGDIAPGTKQAILARYPGDGATGFNVGDLRGALWVEVPSITDTGEQQTKGLQ